MEKFFWWKQQVNSKSAENIYSKEFCILDVRLDIYDGSPALQRLTESLGQRVH